MTTDGLPGSRHALGVIHPGSPVLRVRYRLGVLVTPYGFPDWPLSARAVLDLPPPERGLTRDEVRVVDVLSANGAMAGSGDPLWTVTGPGPVPTPAGWAWAHVGRARQVALVPIELHGAFRHAGGVTTMDHVGPGRGLRGDPAPVAVGPAPGVAVPGGLLDLLERALGWPLPPALRRYLDRTNGAGPAGPGVLPGYGFVADQPLFGLAREDRLQDLSYAPEWFRDRLTVDFLPVGYVQGGLLAVKVSGDDLDSVWYLDDDDPRARDDDRPDEICALLLHRCADSIDDLWARLVRPPAELVGQAERRVHSGQVREVRDEAVGVGLPDRFKPAWQAPAPARADALTQLFEAR